MLILSGKMMTVLSEAPKDSQEPGGFLVKRVEVRQSRHFKCETLLYIFYHNTPLNDMYIRYPYDLISDDVIL